MCYLISLPVTASYLVGSPVQGLSDDNAPEGCRFCACALHGRSGMDAAESDAILCYLAYAHTSDEEPVLASQDTQQGYELALTGTVRRQGLLRMLHHDSRQHAECQAACGIKNLFVTSFRGSRRRPTSSAGRGPCHAGSIPKHVRSRDQSAARLQPSGAHETCMAVHLPRLASDQSTPRDGLYSHIGLHLPQRLLLHVAGLKPGNCTPAQHANNRISAQCAER